MHIISTQSLRTHPLRHSHKSIAHARSGPSTENKATNGHLRTFIAKCRNKLGRIPAKILVHTLFPSINESDVPRHLAKFPRCMRANAPHVTDSARIISPWDREALPSPLPIRSQSRLLNFYFPSFLDNMNERQITCETLIRPIAYFSSRLWENTLARSIHLYHHCLIIAMAILSLLNNIPDFGTHIPRSTLPPHSLSCSSTASILGHHTKSPIPESISHDPRSASPLGYSRSKWVAEAICEQAYLRTPLRGNIAVLRIGQFCGNTENGIWKLSVSRDTLGRYFAATLQ